MAVNTVTVQDVAAVALTGLTPTLQAAAAGGDAFLNDGKTMFRVKNGSGAPITVTFTSQQQCNQGSTHSPANSVAAGGDELFGPFSQSRFNDASGLVQVTYSGVTTLTVAALRVVPATSAGVP